MAGKPRDLEADLGLGDEPVRTECQRDFYS
jgi:hypothetical protein